MAEEGINGQLETAKEENLPLGIYPYEIQITAEDRGSLERTEALKAFGREQRKWWRKTFKGKVPKVWTDPPPGPDWRPIEHYVAINSAAKLETRPDIYPAIVTHPSGMGFDALVVKMPLSAQIIALGMIAQIERTDLGLGKIVSAMRKAFQEKLGVDPRVFEEAEKLVSTWREQRKAITPKDYLDLVSGAK